MFRIRREKNGLLQKRSTGPISLFSMMVLKSILQKEREYYLQMRHFINISELLVAVLTVSNHYSKGSFLTFTYLKNITIEIIKTNRLQDSNIVSITVYGELFGGCYPHSMVKSVSGLNAVQSGIWYTPDLMFAVFDVAIYRKDGTRQFMPFLKMLDECKLAGFFVLEPLFVGSQSQAFSISTEFQSKIPDRLGLPSLDSNLCEGVVLRPESEPPSTCLRVKIKNKQFSELVEADYDPQTDKMDIGRILYRFNRFRIDGAKSKLGDGASDIEVADNAVEDLISDISAESYQMTVLVASLAPEDFQAIRDFVISTFLQNSS